MSNLISSLSVYFRKWAIWKIKTISGDSPVVWRVLMFFTLLFDNFLLNFAICLTYIYSLLSSVFYFGEFFFIFVFLITIIAFRFFFYNSFFFIFLPKVTPLSSSLNRTSTNVSASWITYFNLKTFSLF